MQNTKSESEKKKQIETGGKLALTHSSDSGVKSEVANPSESRSLSKDLAGSLMGLIKDVNKDGVTPETVNASCNCAAQIYKILRLNFEMKKEGL